jgi:thiosulfate/3-mercaptopyruvate sulfurtransferase
MVYTHPEYLISPEALANAMQTDPDRMRLFDVTVLLVPNPPGYKAVSGLEDFQKGHIPGANFLDLLRDFSDTNNKFNFMLPSVEYLQAAYRAAGVSDDSQVVFYSSGHMMWATRAWWMLHSCGHKNVAVLDGSFARWQQEDRSVTSDAASFPAGGFNATFDSACWTDKAQTAAAINDAGTCTINALSPGVYSGEAEMSYGRKGHIENSKNVFYDELLDAGCFRSAEVISQIFTDKGVLEKPRTIAYCGGGISATIDALALKLIGYEDVAVYDGSMGEWASDESLPLVTGSE